MLNYDLDILYLYIGLCFLEKAFIVKKHELKSIIIFILCFCCMTLYDINKLFRIKCVCLNMLYIIHIYMYNYIQKYDLTY